MEQKRQSSHQQPMAAAAGIALAEIAGCTCQRLRRAARRASQIYDAHMAEIGLTGAQFALLAHLYAAEQRGAAATIGRLADAAGMDPTTLTRNLKPLERDGLAAREADPEDRRARRLRLTPLGQSRFAAGTVRWRNAQDDLVRRLGDEVAGRLDAALIAAMAGLEGGDESP